MKLDWSRLIELAQGEARTEPGQYQLGLLSEEKHWASDIHSARLMQQELQEVTLLIEKDALWGPLTDLKDPFEFLDRLSKGAVLEIEQWVILRQWLYAIDSWIQIPREEIKGERIQKVLKQMFHPFNVLRVLDQILTPEGELSEQASPQLGSLFHEIRSLKRRISNILDQLLQDLSQKGVLQETYTDVREGRYVIPVRFSAQHEVEGIIHEASASRQTVFMEPAEITGLNNRLRQSQNDLLQEVHRILQELSRRVEPEVPEIIQAVGDLVHWDTVQARARLGLHYSGKIIELTEKREYSLKQAAHPLLWWSMPPEQIIRNDIEFGSPAQTLLLTGPNTGGKTVLLKTLGLAGMCARTGFPFPATDHPIVPFFDSFYIDLGDSQSIDQQISSFSGHVLKFKEILENVSPNSLILLDELNSATDPEEGAAFGRAILETLMSENAMIVTTTHDPHLKAFSMMDRRILTASMAFDEQSRAPTYRLVLGVPGRSRALETAARLGIPAQVIDLARSYLSKAHGEFESLLSKLDAEVQTAIRARREALALRGEAERLQSEWKVKTETSFEEMIARSKTRLKRALEDAQIEIRSAVQKLDENRSRREVDETRTRLNQIFQKASQGFEQGLQAEVPELRQMGIKIEPELEQKKISETISVGDWVRVPKWKSKGQVLEISAGKIKVAIGTLQMSLSLSEVEIISKGTSQPKGRTRVQVQTPSSNLSGSQGEWNLAGPSSGEVLDIRGLYFEDAMARVESYLDQAFRNGSYVEVTIVHGLGTGALREGTRKILKNLPYVKVFHDGGAGRGGTGATVVEFDR